MVSAIWSMPPYEASQMPLTFFLSFFKNHGLFKLKIDHNGIQLKIEAKHMLIKLVVQISGEHFKNYNINKIVRNNFGVKIFMVT